MTAVGTREALRREVRRLWGSGRWMLAERGPSALAADAADLVTAYATYPLARRRFAGETFAFRGRSIPYARHHYNRAWRNERSVELALAADFLSDKGGRRTLEVGNVLSHYGPADHDVLDKYESSPGVVNADVVDFDPPEPYEVIVSISTLEHVGWDERPREPAKVLAAYTNLRRILAPGGAMLVTCPVGQNPHLDEYLRQGRLDFDVLTYLRRRNRANEWDEVGADDVAGAAYGTPFRNANAIAVGLVGPRPTVNPARHPPTDPPG